MQCNNNENQSIYNIELVSKIQIFFVFVSVFPLLNMHIRSNLRCTICTQIKIISNVFHKSLKYNAKKRLQVNLDQVKCSIRLCIKILFATQTLMNFKHASCTCIYCYFNIKVIFQQHLKSSKPIIYMFVGLPTVLLIKRASQTISLLELDLQLIKQREHGIKMVSLDTLRSI